MRSRKGFLETYHLQDSVTSLKSILLYLCPKRDKAFWSGLSSLGREVVSRALLMPEFHPFTVEVCQSADSKGEKMNDFDVDVNAKDADGKTPLHHAAAKNAYKKTTILLERGADVNEKDKLGKTPLHYAAENNAYQTATLMLKYGADPNIYNNDDWRNGTPLHYAAYKNAHNTAKVLLEHGADINAKAKYGDTALHNTKWNDAHNTAKVLLENGALVNAEDDLSSTPLHSIAWKNAHETAKVLLEHGADINAKNTFGKTPSSRLQRTRLTKQQGCCSKMVRTLMKRITMAIHHLSRQYPLLRSEISIYRMINTDRICQRP